MKQFGRLRGGRVCVGDDRPPFICNLYFGLKEVWIRTFLTFFSLLAKKKITHEANLYLLMLSELRNNIPFLSFDSYLMNIFDTFSVFTNSEYKNI